MKRLLALLVLTAGVLSAGWPNGYAYRRTITLLHSQVSGSDQTNFPVVFATTLADLAVVGSGGQVQNASGFDIIFTSDPAGSTKLAWEQEVWTSTTGAVVYWIKIPTLSHTVDTPVYLFYGNAGISTFQGDVNGTWANNYTGVYHFNASGTQTDSTSGAHNLNLTIGTPAFSNSNSRFGYAFTGNGSNAVYATSVTFPPAGPVSISMWFKFPAAPEPGGQEIVSVGGNNSTNARFGLFVINALGGFQIENSTASSTAAWVADTVWHHVVITIPASATPQNDVLYLDGVSQTLTLGDSSPYGLHSGDIAVNAVPGAEGACCWSNAYIDEAEISSVQRSADWVATQFNNQSTPSSFYTVGPSTVAGKGRLILN